MKRALVEKRPYLLLSIAAAMAFYYLRASDLPEFYTIPVKGAAVAMLAVYAFVRHSSPTARTLVWALGAASLADMAIEVDFQIGGLLFFLFHMLMVLGIFLQNRRAALSKSQSWVVGLTFILTPIVAYFLPSDREMAWLVALYALSLGAMASAAWASQYPRYRVGAGAMLFLFSDLLIFAGLGPLQGHFASEYLVWPIYYLGMFLICTGIIQTLRKNDPELKLVE